MEQLVARRAHNPKVTGSSPVPATKQLVDRFTVNFLCFIGLLMQFVNKTDSNRFQLALNYSNLSLFSSPFLSPFPVFDSFLADAQWNWSFGES